MKTLFLILFLAAGSFAQQQTTQGSAAQVPVGIGGGNGGGSVGPIGPAGPQGPTGSNGVNGNSVLNGTSAPTNQGNNGDFFILTTTNCLYGPKASGTWPGVCASLVGPQGLTGATGNTGATGLTGATGAAGATGATGAAGANGNTLLNGTVAPTSQGANGDFFLNTTTKCLYGPKASGTWPGTCTSIIGPTGPAGSTGPTGQGYNWRGAWSGATAYVPYDSVSIAGSSYVSILASTNQTPPNATYWNLIAQAGTNGTNGAGVTWRGAWSSVTTYAPYDSVSLSGTSYVSILSNTNQSPPNATYWNVLAQAGANGTNGQGYNWRGAWSSGATYIPYDSVSIAGNSYVSILGSTNQSPPNATYWNLIAQAGTNGTNGSNGTAGQGYTWRGAWSGGTAYVPYDTISYLGSSYVSILGSTGQTPTNTTYWSLIAQVGATGATGAAGSGTGGQGCYAPTVTYTNSTTLSISTGCVVIDGSFYNFSSSPQITISSGTPTIRVYISDGSDNAVVGTLVVRNSASSGVSCSLTCQVQNSQSTFPGQSIPTSQWTATSAGAWDTAPATADLRANQSTVTPYTFGTGINCVGKVCSSDTSRVPQKFSGSGAPGVIAGNTLGDFYLDTPGNDTYQCFASTCTAVAAGNWVKVDSAGSASASFTATAGTGGVTVNMLASKDSGSNPLRYVIPSANGCGAGVALSSAASGSTFLLQTVAGLVNVIADNAITSGHILVGGSTTPGRVADSGQTSRSAIPSSTCVLGVAQANATAGSLVSILYEGVGGYGTQQPVTAVGSSAAAVTSLVIVHNLNTTIPWVTCYDGSGNVLGGNAATTFITNVVANSANQVTVTFSGATTGTCSVSSGGGGGVGPTGSVGPTGPAGAAGNTLLSGAGIPSSGLGNNGDFYINQTTNIIYGPKSSGAWPGSGTSMIGPAGSAGITGINSQTGTSYTFVNSDCSKLVTFNNASATAASLPQAGGSGNFPALCTIRAINLGAGTVTITPSTSTVNLLSTLSLTTGQGGSIYSDGSNYTAELGKGSAATGPTTNQNIRQMSVTFVNGGAALTGSTNVCREYDYGGTFTKATLIGDVSGNATVDIRQVAYTSYTGPGSTSTITGSGTIPNLSSAAKYQDTSLTGWSTTLNPGSVVCYFLSSPSTVTSVTLTLSVAAN